MQEVKKKLTFLPFEIEEKLLIMITAIQIIVKPALATTHSLS